MTIYADSNRLSGTCSQKLARVPAIIDRIREISEAKGNVPIHVLAPNMELFNRLQKALSKEYPNIFWDYYRSSNTMGVESDRRTIIAVGLAEVPKNAYDCIADSYSESQSIRVGSVDAATWQAWSRAKDPEGQALSEVYCIGARTEDIQRVVTWGPGRCVVKQSKYRYGVICDEYLPRPHIREIYKELVNARLRKASPYIKKIWNSEDDLAGGLPVYESKNKSRNSLKPRINIIRENNELNVLNFESSRYFGAIVSNPENSEELWSTINALDTFFRSNRENHAQQQKQPDRKGKFGYRPRKTQDWPMLVHDMLYNGVTVATYGMGENGLTVQCALDFDNHAGDNPALRAFRQRRPLSKAYWVHKLW